MRKEIILTGSKEHNSNLNDFHKVCFEQLDDYCEIRLQFTPEQWERFKEFVNNVK